MTIRRGSEKIVDRFPIAGALSPQMIQSIVSLANFWTHDANRPRPTLEVNKHWEFSHC